MRRRAAKIDTTQPQIVDAFRAAGFLVCSMASHGKGLPDLLVGYGDRLWLVECKTGKGKLTSDQVQFKADGWPFFVIRSAEEALALVALLKKASRTVNRKPIQITHLTGDNQSL